MAHFRRLLRASNVFNIPCLLKSIYLGLKYNTMEWRFFSVEKMAKLFWRKAHLGDCETIWHHSFAVLPCLVWGSPRV